MEEFNVPSLTETPWKNSNCVAGQELRGGIQRAFFDGNSVEEFKVPSLTETPWRK